MNCYRCDQPGTLRLSWLGYPSPVKGRGTTGEPSYNHDRACSAHALVARDYAVITKSTDEAPWQ